MTILATGWSLLAAVCLLWPGIGTGAPDTHLPPGFAGQRLQFELLVLVPVAAVVVASMAYQLAVRHEGAVESGPPPV